MTGPYFLIRNTLYDKGELPSGDPVVQFSPDIICTQKIISYSQAEAEYDQWIGEPFRQHTPNRIYVRVRNNTGKMQEGQVRLFYGTLNGLYAKAQWTPIKTENQGYVTRLAQPGTPYPKAGAIALTDPAFKLWDVPDNSQHYVLLAQSRTADSPWLELPTGWANDYELWKYLREHPQTGLAMLNIR